LIANLLLVLFKKSSQVSEEPIRKSWRLSGYKTISELQNVEGSIHTLTVASQENMAAEVERVDGREAADHFTILKMNWVILKMKMRRELGAWGRNPSKI